MINKKYINNENLSNVAIVGSNDSVRDSIPFSIWIIIFYLFLIYCIMPVAYNTSNEATGFIQEHTFGQQVGPPTSIFHRLPLVMGAAMVTISLLTKRRLPGMILPIALFLIYSCGYLINGTWGPMGIFESTRLFFASTGVGLCLVLTIRKPNHLDHFLKAILVLSLANALYGLLFTIPGLAILGEGVQSLGLLSGRDKTAWRLVGLLGDPTNCGLMLMVGFLIILDKLVKKITMLDLALSLTFILAIFLTFSRTTWFATLVGGIFFMWQKKIAPAKIAMLSIIGGLFILIAHNIFSFSIEHNQFRWHIAESDTRSGVWLFWLAIALKNPLGYGIGYIVDSGDKYLWEPPHNIYLSTWVDGGIQTLIPLLLLLWICFKRQWHIRKYIDPETGKEYGPLVLSLLVAIAVSLLGLSYMMQLLFIAIGLCYSCSLLAQDGLLVPQDKTSR